jgi:N-acetylneuraminic acid mutarotase
MRSRSLVLGILALGAFGLTACTDETTTEPSRAAEPNPTAPELAVASNTWLTKRDMPFGRLDLTTAVVPNASGQSILYAIGGSGEHGFSLDSVHAYNVATNTWSRKARLPSRLKATNGTGVINGKIYVSGGLYRDEWSHGDDPFGTLYVYDPRTNTWTQKAYMPESGARGVTGVIDGKLYVVSTCYEAVPDEYYFDTCDAVEGGRSRATNFFRYNPVTDRWARLPRPRGDYHMGGVLYGKLYVTDGKKVEAYDPSTNQWTTKASGPQGRAYSAVTVLWGRLYLMGGWAEMPTGWQVVRTMAVYHPLTDKWTTAAPMPTARSNVAASRVDLNGKPRVEVVGGNAPGNNLQYVP